jgi:acyl-CoA synthetase (AMP-forming)/AMP-acid ligase II
MYALPRETMTPDDVMISYLPLSHIAAQITDLHLPMKLGYQVYFANPDALKGSLGATLKDVRPTVFFGVPRVWVSELCGGESYAKSHPSDTFIQSILPTGKDVWCVADGLTFSCLTFIEH